MQTPWRGSACGINMAPGERIGVLGRMGGGSTVGAVLAALLLPKCPLCIAALLGAAGIGATSAILVAPWLRPACIVLAVIGAMVFVASRRYLDRVSSRSRCGCDRSRSHPSTARTFRRRPGTPSSPATAR